MVSRRLYTLLVYLLIPLALLRLAWRGVRAPGYLRRWPERFGYFTPPSTGARTAWIHAVSVGEAQAAAPLAQALRRRYPKLPVVITTTTPTGSRRVRDALGETVFHVYLPYDLPGALRRFLQRTRPRIAIIMETELWPNLFYACRQRNVPVLVANARLSERSAGRYRRVAGLTRQTLRQVSAIAAQTADDADRMIALGADRSCVRVTGSIKFDAPLPRGVREQAARLRGQWGATRPVWIAASTHEGEDRQILDALDILRNDVPDCLLLLAPRHPERFAQVIGLCRRLGLRTVRRSGQTADSERMADAQVFVGDTMGELFLFYAAADVAFVGGSLVPTGGHNPLEPAALGLPVLSGPHVFNFKDIFRRLQEAGAATEVADAAALAAAARRLLLEDSARRRAGEQGRKVVAQNRGALERLLEMAAGYLD